MGRCTGSLINPTPGDLSVEAVEKIPEQILARGVEKSDLIGCATINDLMFGRKGQGIPANRPLIAVGVYRLVICRIDRGVQ